MSIFFNMDVYTIVSLDDGTDKVKHTTTTTCVRKCGPNPTFNYTMRFTLDDSLLHNHHSSLKIQLVGQHPLICIKNFIAAFHVPLKELFDSADPKGITSITSSQVWRPFSSMRKGELSFSYKFGER
ncbi:hypothetical protein ACLB2K_038996 [Fragaria x ananassa]